MQSKLEYGKNALGDVYEKTDRDYEKALTLTSIELADDGKLYLMRHTPAGPVYSVSPAGVISQSISLSPPPGAYFSEVKVSKGIMVAKYVRNKPDSNQLETIFLVTTDLASGQKTGEYSHSDYRIGSALAGFSPNDFVFLGNDKDNHLTIVHTRVP